MSTPIYRHVLGSYGQIIRAGGWVDANEDPRDLTGMTVTCRFYPPSGPAVDRVAAGAADGTAAYQVTSADLDSVGTWGARIFVSDGDENLPSGRATIIVEADA